MHFGYRRELKLLCPLCLGLLLAAGGQLACSDPTPAELPRDAALAGEGGSDASWPPDSSREAAPWPDSAAPRSAACLAQDELLQQRLDAVRTSPNALLAVKNQACGTSVYVSGDPSSGSITSLWRVGSVSKTYVAATILSLVAEGVISLADPLSRWDTSLPDSEAITVRMLLNHTSGIFNCTDDPAYTPVKEWQPPELVALAAKHPLNFPPGSGWSYSNTNYLLLGLIIEAVTGLQASAAIRQRALVPAALEQTFLEGEEPLQGSLAAGFDQNRQDVTALYSMSGPWTSGAMVADGADLCNWVAALYGEPSILPQTQRRLMVEQAVETSPTRSYGLGVTILDSSITHGAGPALGHSGGIPGFNTQAYWFPDKQTAICAVVNQQGADPNEVSVAALQALFQ